MTVLALVALLTLTTLIVATGTGFTGVVATASAHDVQTPLGGARTLSATATPPARVQTLSATATLAPRLLPGVYPNVLVIGNSLTAGTGASNVHKAYPEDLTRDLRAQHPASARAWAPIGLAGYSTGQMLNTLRSLQLTAHPDLLVVELGTNDWAQSRSLSAFQTDYTAVLSLVTAWAPSAQLVCLTGWPRGTTTNHLGLTMAPYDAIITQTCRAASSGAHVINLTPIYDVPANHDSFDGYHPSDAGHQAIADAIAATLRQGV